MGDNIDALRKVGDALWSALRFDNWQNLLTGLGTARDKTTYGQFVPLGEVNWHELTSLYHQNDTAKRIVALKPQEMMRQGYVVNVPDDTAASTKLMRKLRDLQANKLIRDAMIWGRLYGGSVVFMGVDDGQATDQPLNEENIKSVRFLQTVDRRWLVPSVEWGETMLGNEYSGEPQTYRIINHMGAGNVLVHRSRLLIFGGAHTSDEERWRLGRWDHSVLTHMYEALRQFDTSWKSAEHLMSDASQAVFKIQGLMSMIAGGNKDVLQTRMQLVDMSRSVARAIMLDADGGEDFARQASSFTDAQAMLDKFMLRLSAAAEVPVTILMGQSPAGMNATGESDFRWWYDSIRTAQENDLRPQLEKLISYLMLAQDGDFGGEEPEGWELKFHPLWQMSAKEQAELQKTTAETDAIYMTAEVVLPEEVALSRFRPEGWSAETVIDRDARETVLKAAIDKMEADPTGEEEAEKQAALQAKAAGPLPEQPPQDAKEAPDEQDA